MHYVKEGWPNTINCKDVLHYKKLEDSLITEEWMSTVWSTDCHTSQTEEPGTANYTPGTLWDAADEIFCPLSGILAAHQQ